MDLKVVMEKTLISHLKTNKKLSSGFSLLEILIAVALLGLTIGLVVSPGPGEREKLELAIEDISRALRFCRSEAVIRNKIVRLKLLVNDENIQYTVEYSDNANLLLPEYVDENRLDRKEKEKLKSTKDKVEKGFIPVEEFQDQVREINPDVKLSGVSTTLSRDLIVSGEASIYFYPTGHQDEALVVLSTVEEVVSLEVEAFRDRIYENFFPIGEILPEQYENTLYEKTKEIYDKWKKSRE